MTANEARELMKDSFRTDAIQDAIATIEGNIKKYAAKGHRSCYVSFYSHPGGYNDFISKYGKEHHNDYKMYDVKEEVVEYFANNGFNFKYVTDCILGGVRQDPFWEICW